MNPSLSLPAPVRSRTHLFFRRYSWLLAAWLLALVGLDSHLPTPPKEPLELAIELDSSVASTAQVFYDTGHGVNAAESVTAPVAAGGATQTLAFALPPEPVQAVRFDPLTLPGTVHLHRLFLRRPDTQQEVRTFDLTQTTAMHEIARLAMGPDGLEVVTTKDSLDSQLGLPVTSLGDGVTLTDKWQRWVGVDVSATLLVLLALGALLILHRFLGSQFARVFRPVFTPFRWLDARFAAWATRLDRPEIMRLDRGVFWFYGACALVFGSLAALGLHGSSLSLYSPSFPWSDVKTAPLLGEGRGIRVDEWAEQTPAFLNQAFRRQPFHAKTTAVGNLDAALLHSLPCRDFTLAFRPQYWAFWVLPMPAAFAIYWQFKGFALLTGIFSLLLLLTRGRTGLAILGALWVFFSAHIQWCYSWPSMLPEMIGYFGWTLCLTLYLAVGRNRYLLAAAGVGVVFSAVNFALCFYPPHQIPFVLFGVGLVPVWLWIHREFVLRRDLAARHLLALAGCWGLVLLILAGFGLEVRAAIKVAANTVYPGQRVSSGGGVPVEFLLSQFLDFWKSGVRYPAMQGNICESTGFLWLLPVTLCLPRRRSIGNWRGVEILLAVCWLVAAVIAAWMIFPVPPGLGRFLLLNHVPAVRCLPALGLINVTGVILYLALRSPVEPEAAAPGAFRRLPLYFAVLLGALALLTLTNAAYQVFFLPYEVALGAVYGSALVICVLERLTPVFAVVVLGPLILAYGLVNPVDRGLRAVTDSALYRTVHSDSRYREGKWLVFSHDYMLTGFVVATGADVFNSFKVLPNLDAMAVFDPAGVNRHSYNQSGHTVVRPLPEGQPSLFETPDVGLLRWSVSPLDPGLRRVGVRFLVFDEEPAAALSARLRRIAPEVPHVWIYELP